MDAVNITMDSDNLKVFQHPTLYFADGNIVLSAVSATQNQQKRTNDNTPGESDAQTILFRVHKCLLQENSDIFRNMFELPEAPSGVNESRDGVPVVKMQDSAKEVEDMLRIFYRPWEMRLQKHHPDTCLQINNVLFMATKYQFSDIIQLLVAHIEADWPKTLDEWDWFEDYAKLLPPFQKAGYTRPEPASTLVVAWRFGIHRILPAVFYDLGRINVSDDWDDRDSPKKSLFTFSSNLSHGKEATVQVMTRRARWRLLWGEHYRVMLLGHERIWSFIREKEIASDHEGAFCGKEECRRKRRIVVDSVYRIGKGKIRDPLDNLRSQLSDMAFLDVPCHECKRALGDRIKWLRGEIWRRLPEFFDSNPKVPVATSCVPVTLGLG